MGYIGSDPKTKESVSTSQLINDSVTNEKIVDDILFTSVTSSIVSASHITASSYQGGFDTGTSTRISGSLGANATTIRNLTSAGITGSFSPSSASFSTRTTTLEVASGSLSTRVTTNESDLTTLKGSGTVQGVSTGNTPTFAGVTVTGTLTAQEVHTEFESASIIFTSGSTKFGNTIDDTHQVTGSLLMTGSMAVGTGRGMSPNGLFEVGLNNDGTRRFSVSFEDSIVSLSAKNQSNNGENLKLMGDDVIIHTGTNTSGTERLRVTDGGHVSSSVNISIIKGNAMLNVEEIGGSKGYLFSGGSFTALRTTSNTTLNFAANYSSADNFIISSESKISLSNNDSGTSNTIFGKNAGASLDAGSNYNTFIGEGVADASMNDATDNVGVGYQALSALTTGDDNVAVGMRALLDLEGGNKNTGLGDSAGRGITSGEENVMVGYQAGDGITSGGANCIVGVNAAGAGNADYITAIGREAARDLNSTDANGTTAVGTNAIAALTSGQANTAVGFQTLKDCDVGDFNTAVGYQALKDFDPGSDGHGSNTAVGYRAGYSISTSENSTFLGARAGEATTGAGNVIIGREAGRDMTSGANCVIIGHGAAAANNTRDGLVIIGSGAGASLTSGDANTFVGGGAGRNVSSGDHNTLLGYHAGYDLVAASSHNTLIGKEAGANINVSGDGNNTCLGSEAGDVITSGQNNTIIGAGCDPTAADSDNAIVLGVGITGGGNEFNFGKASNIVSNTFTSNANFSQSSDKRLKREIKDNTLGINFINELKTKTYKWLPSNKVPKELTEHYNEENQKDTNVLMYGMLAQDVKEAMDKYDNPEFTGWNEKSDGSQNISREMFVIPLIKAVQELSSEIENIKKTCKCMNE